MKTLLLAVLTCFILGSCKPAKESTQINGDTLYLSYYFSAELVYENITIDGKKLTYRHLAKEFKCPDNYVVQAPCYSDNDLVTEEISLTGPETDELIQLIKKSGFPELNGNYGGADDSQRFYPYSLSVKLNGKESKVVYQSFPGAKPMPEAFKMVQSRVINLAKSKAMK